MKLFLSLFLSLQIVTNFTFFEDMVRIPVLIDHYRDHKAHDAPEISFFDFIAMHYFNEITHTDIDHNSLPLNHSCDIGHVHVTPAFTLPESLKLFTQTTSIVKHMVYFEEFIPNHNLDSIFQPPKTIC